MAGVLVLCNHYNVRNCRNSHEYGLRRLQKARFLHLSWLEDLISRIIGPSTGSEVAFSLQEAAVRSGSSIRALTMTLNLIIGVSMSRKLNCRIYFRGALAGLRWLFSPEDGNGTFRDDFHGGGGNWSRQKSAGVEFALTGWVPP